MRRHGEEVGGVGGQVKESVCGELEDGVMKVWLPRGFESRSLSGL